MAKIINVISDKNVPKWGNGKKYIAIHYLGVVGQNNKVEAGVSIGMALSIRQPNTMQSCGR